MATYELQQVMLPTKSIDVGSMFLMDLSVNESDLHQSSSGTHDNQATEETIFPSATATTMAAISSNSRRETSNNIVSISSSSSTSIACNSNNRANYMSRDYSDYPSNSLDRLANVINSCSSDCEMEAAMSITGTSYATNNLATIIESRKDSRNQIVVARNASSNPASSSLSDESYVASGSSSTTSDDSCSLSVSYAASAHIDEERVSTTTREDSGVLDMKDLDNNHHHQTQYYNLDSNCENYVADCDDAACNNDSIANKHFGQQNQLRIYNQRDGKQVLRTIMSANLDEHDSAVMSDGHKSTSIAPLTTTTATDARKPTDSRSFGQDNQLFQYNQPHSAGIIKNNCDNDHRRRSGRPMSASLPIQVPVRQLKRDLNKLKLNLAENINFNEETVTNEGKFSDNCVDATHTAVDRHGNNNNDGTNNQYGNRGDADDDFLNQEYNDNHHNHYSNDDFDENIRADENPMKVFESIQALAKSLHKDTDIFGSLPRKRL